MSEKRDENPSVTNRFPSLLSAWIKFFVQAYLLPAISNYRRSVLPVTSMFHTLIAQAFGCFTTFVFPPPRKVRFTGAFFSHEPHVKSGISIELERLATDQ